MQRNPDRDELARRVSGITPKEAEELAYKTNTDTHWFPPSAKEKKKAEDLVILALVTGERIRLGLDLMDAPPEEIELVEKFQREHPECLPIIKDGNTVGWRREGLEFLKQYIDEERLDSALDYRGVPPES